MIFLEWKKLWHWKFVHRESIKYGSFFMKNHADSYFILVSNPKQPLHPINPFKNPFNYILLFDQVWLCNIKQVLSYSKNYIHKYMQTNSWHKLFHFHLSFRIWKVWKGREKIAKTWISWEWKELFRSSKKCFS